jgi:cytochrome c oxidase subunit 2
MNVHTYEKIWLVVALALIVGFIGTVTYGAVGAGIEMVDNEGGTIDATAVSEDPRFADPGVERVGENEYEAYVISQQFIFRPSPLEVPANSRVTFYITSIDVIHGFEVVGTNVNTMVIPGQVTEITVEFDEPAEYGIICNEYCGEGHHDMEGKLVVVPEDEYEGGSE